MGCVFFISAILRTGTIKNRSTEMTVTQGRSHTKSSRPRTTLPLLPLLPLLLAGASLSMVMSGCASSFAFGPRVHHTYSAILPHIVGSAMSIDTVNGSIEAIGVDRADVSIVVDLSGHDADRLAQAIVHTDRLDDDTLSISVHWPDGKRKHNEGASISVELPNADGIEAHTSNGRITIAGLSGHADLRSSNGSIKVDRHDGSIYADTSNGKIQAERVSGEIEMYSSNGPIVITDAFGPIRVETSNGNAYVSTMDGNEGPIRIRTSNGRVDLDLGDGFVGVLKCQTSNGKVRVTGLDDAQLVEVSKRRVELRVGESDKISAVRTSNGSVRVRGKHTEPMDD